MPIVVVTRGAGGSAGGTVSGGDADTVDGRHAEEFALLTGADFTGAVTAPSFTGDGGGLSNVDAASLGGQPASAYARLTGATFAGEVGAPRAYIGAADTRRAAGAGSASLEMGGRAGSWTCNVQDGTGRVNYRWNATGGRGPKYLEDGEAALEWDADGYGSYGLTIRYAPRGTAGDAIVWQDIMSAGLTGLRVWGPIKPKTYQRSALPSADLLAGMIAYVSDGPDGPCLAVYDGTNWRAVALGAAL